MMMQPANWLIATAVLPLAAAVGVFLAQSMNNRRWGLFLARAGIAGGVACSVTLACLLYQQVGFEDVVQVTIGKWISFSQPQAISITFGFEANLIKAGLFGFIGIPALIALWKADSTSKPFSDDLILMNSLLYAAGAVFVFAPNLAQSLMGWGAISWLVSAMMRSSKQPSGTAGVDTPLEFGRSTPIPQSDRHQRPGPGIISTIDSLVQLLEWGFEQVEKWLTSTLPYWLTEEAELVNNSPITVQMLTALLGMSAILLTWLFIPAS